MRAARISGVLPRKRRHTTVRLPGLRVALDLVERDCRPDGPNLGWSADIAYISTWEGFLYLAHVQDLFSPLIVGWSTADHLRAALVVDALEMALYRRRRAPGLIHHSGQGCQCRLNRSSQHLTHRSCDGSTASEVRSSRSAVDVLAGSSVGGASRGAPAVLGGDRLWCVHRGCGGRGGGVRGGWRPVVPRGWWDVYRHPGLAIGALLVVGRTRRGRDPARPRVWRAGDRLGRSAARHRRSRAICAMPPRAAAVLSIALRLRGGTLIGAASVRRSRNWSPTSSCEATSRIGSRARWSDVRTNLLLRQKEVEPAGRGVR